MTTAEIIRLSQPRDLIALIPYRLGFHPAESAVLVAVSVAPGGAKEVGLVARMDLADLGAPLTGAEAAAVLAGHVAAQEPDDLHLVLYTEEPEDDRLLHDVVDNLAAALDEALWPLAPELDPWRVGPQGWGHLGPCRCCPPAGHPLDLLAASPAAAAMVTAGHAAAPDRAQLGVVRSRDGDALATAYAAAEAERDRLREVRRACGGAPLVRGAAFGVPGARPARDQEPLRRWREEGARLWDAAVAAGPGSPRTAPEVLGRLLVVLGDKVVRDAVVAATMEAAEGRTGDYLDPGTVVRAFETDLIPDDAAVGRATTLAHAVAAHAEPGAGGSALGALAYLAWWGNEGARADVVARQALQEEPGHRLAELVVAALEAGMPPVWARTP